MGGVFTITGGVGSPCGGVCGVRGGAFRGSNVGPRERARFRPVEILASDSGLAAGEDSGTVFSSLELFSEPLFERNTSLSRFPDVDLFGGSESGCRRLWVRDFLSEGVDSRLSEESCGKVEDRVDNPEISEDRTSEVCDSGLYFSCTRGEDVVRCPIWDGWTEMAVGRVSGLASECHGCQLRL